MVWILSAFLTAGFYGSYTAFFLCAAALAVLVRAQKQPRAEAVAAVLLAAAVFIWGGVASTASRRDLAVAAEYAAALGGRAVRLDGWVSGCPEYRLGGVRFPLSTTIGARPVRLLVTGVAFGLLYGDSVSTTGRFSRTREDRTGHLVSAGAAGYFRAHKGRIVVTRTGAAGSRPKRWAGRWHENVRRTLARGVGTGVGIPLALAIGDRGSLSTKSRAVFSRLGITHLLALSGMHLGLIAAVVLSLLRLFRIRGRFVLILVMTGYVGLAGQVVSLHRAYVMALLLMLAGYAERPVKPLDALGTALFCLLLASPALSRSVAFQLSFAATFAVLACLDWLPPTARTGRLRNAAGVFKAAVVIGACVQVFLLPVQLFYFGGISACTPLATAVFFPVVALVLLLSGVAVALGSVVPQLFTMVFDALSFVSVWFERTLAWTSSHAPPLFSLPIPNFYLYYAGLCICWLSRKRRWLVAPGVLLCAAAFVLR